MKKNTDRKVSRLSALRDKIAGDGGFTLLEVLAVMVIVGLLAAITIPQISKWREKAYVTSMKTDARNVANAAEANYVDSQVYTEPTVAGGDYKLNAANSVNDFTVVGDSFSFNITSTKAPDALVTYDSAAATPLVTTN